VFGVVAVIDGGELGLYDVLDSGSCVILSGDGTDESRSTRNAVKTRDRGLFCWWVSC
jgi:hypothetical protein